ncbi:unnamed protein product [Orchesella dallaii]|uniref:Uncharacterized protein n=1 Tax=Orchesella dallaii TaxID=48710 RepID=A0ABP1RSB7_9HEXA
MENPDGLDLINLNNGNPIINDTNNTSASAQPNFQISGEVRSLDSKSENKQLHKEVKFHNLIVSGIVEKASETNENLRQIVDAFITRICNKNIGFDTIYRIDSKNMSNRPVRVRFFCHSDRNMVYQSTENLPDDLYINEDLPYSMR